MRTRAPGPGSPCKWPSCRRTKTPFRSSGHQGSPDNRRCGGSPTPASAGSDFFHLHPVVAAAAWSSRAGVYWSNPFHPPLARSARAGATGPHVHPWPGAPGPLGSGALGLGARVPDPGTRVPGPATRVQPATQNAPKRALVFATCSQLHTMLHKSTIYPSCDRCCPSSKKTARITHPPGGGRRRR
jgi:hypothetical protein